MRSRWSSGEGGFARLAAGHLARMSLLARMPAALAAVALSLVLLAADGGPAASAAGGDCTTEQTACAVPSCWATNVRYGRPGISREYLSYCPHTKRVEIVGTPEGGTVERLETYQGAVGLRFRPSDPYAGDGRVTLKLIGTTAEREVTFHVKVVPLEQNTAPVCRPISGERRSDGASRVEVSVRVECDDAEGDGLTIDAGGPGDSAGPQTVEGGDPTSSRNTWVRYTPAATSGTEEARYWAVDDLGARSSDAKLTVSVGPTDRPTICYPNPWYVQAVPPIFTRPGAIRGFMISCNDPDGDEFSVEMGRRTEHGLLQLVEVGESSTSDYWGSTRPVELRYTPTTLPQDDPFSLVTVTNGKRVEQPLEMKMSPLPQQHGGGCGYGSGRTTVGEPVTVAVTCDDGDGDPIPARIAQAPQHGEATLEIEQTPVGVTHFRVRYVPEDGFTGEDCVVLALWGIGHDEPMRITVDLEVREPEPEPQPEPQPEPGDPTDPVEEPLPPGAPSLPPPLAPNDPPVMAPPPGFPRSASVVPASLAPSTPAPERLAGRPAAASSAPAVAAASQGSPEADAKRALGARAVVLVKRVGDVALYADAVAWRRGLSLTTAKPALAAACAAESCSVRTRVRVERGAGARASRALRGASGTAARGRALPLGLTLTARDRQALRGKRGLQAAFTVTAAGGKVKSATVRVAVRG